MDKDIVLITGGDGNIAKSMVKTYLSNGDKVIAIDRKNMTDEKEFINHENYEYYQADVTDVKQLQSIYEEIKNKYNKITHLISAAGMPINTELDGLEEATIEDIDQSIKLNLNSHIYIVKTFLPLLKEENKKNKTITLISSVNGLKAFDVPGYSAGKAGILGFMYSIVRDLGKMGIRINTITPGTVVSQKDIELGEKFCNYKYKNMLALDEFTKTQDIADAVFSVTKLMKALTGQNIIVDSGQTL